MPRSTVLMALLLVYALPASAHTTSTGQPPYTETQAELGRTLYEGRCAMCHGQSLEGSWETPPLTGRFAANWGGTSLSGLEAYIRRAMPQMAPGTLSPEDTVALIAFLLKQNGTKPSSTPLPVSPDKLSRFEFPKNFGF